MKVFRCCVFSLSIATVSFTSGAQTPPQSAPPIDVQAMADSIQLQVAEIRGLAFKRPVKAEIQSGQDFGTYMDNQLKEATPPSVAMHYGKIVRRLGLYNGPEIQDGANMMKMVMTSQAAAYYDPNKQTFYVLMTNMPEMALGMFFAHELHHGLQDQNFDLNAYMLHPSRQRRLASDEILARQAVVEGEATYIMSLWLLKKMTGSIPNRNVMQMAVQQQANMDIEAIRAAMKNPQVAQMMGSDVEAAMNAADTIPPYLFDAMIGSYLKGLSFVFAVEEKGWKEVDKLYTTQPPISTEQILHPEKWFAGEVPTRVEFPPFTDAELRDYELLESDVMGEFTLGSVLRAQGLTAESGKLAAGWDGDRYAVFKRKDSNDTLLLFTTAWDSEIEAKEFAEGYKRALITKYPDGKESANVTVDGKQVRIVEGGKPNELKALIKFVAKAKLTRAT